MSIKERAKTLGFPSAKSMVLSTGYANSTLAAMEVDNPKKFEVITLSARIGQLTMIQLSAMLGGEKKQIASKRLCDMTSEELKTIFGEAKQ
jgi:hypothetical protein